MKEFLLLPFNFIRSFGTKHVSGDFKLCKTFNHYFDKGDSAHSKPLTVARIERNCLAINICHIMGILVAFGVLFSASFGLLLIIPGIGVATKVSFIIIFSISLILSKIIYKPTIGKIEQKYDYTKPFIAGLIQFSIFSLEIISAYLIVKLLLFLSMSLVIWMLLLFVFIFALYHFEKKRAESII